MSGVGASTERGGVAAAGLLADPVTTEVVRHGLNSAAEQMKRALCRTSFSPVIYEILDFAVALYDRHFRLLAQAPSNPLFMGTMGFLVEHAVAAVGGEDSCEPGDIVVINVPYTTGSHQQDVGFVSPVHVAGELVGYAALKAHWQDFGAKAPYCSDTTDVFQEGVILPGVKLYARGERVDGIYRIALANSRTPEMVAGDINASVVAVRTGAAAFARIVARHEPESFRRCVERMFDHGEAVMRRRLASIPDGRYTAYGEMDNDGVSAAPVGFEVAVTVADSELTIDFSAAPPAVAGPVNCPLPSTVSASRVAVAMLAGPHEPPNEGHFRPIAVRTLAGSIFHPLPPSPIYLNGWLAMQAIDVIHRALAGALPAGVPAGSGGCICGLIWWGERAGQEPWSDSTGHPIGHGADIAHDGPSALMHLGEAASRFASAEVFETRYPLLWEQAELASDSCGAGTFRGGLGVDVRVTALDDAYVTCVVDRTTLAPWGLAGGGAGRPNAARLVHADGRIERCDKVTALRVERGASIEVSTGGGGGVGPPAGRDPAAVRADLAGGYITPEHARAHYPHAVDRGEQAP